MIYTLIYKFLLYSTPVLLGVLAFIGGLAVKAIQKMSYNIGEIKTTVEVLISKHDDLERRVDKVEDKCDK